MIIDHRIYTTQVGRTAEFVAMYRDHAWPLQQQHLGRCLGWFATIEGELNTIVHIWAYDSQADRETRRNALAADPAWAAYLDMVATSGVLTRMENRIMRPVSFSPVQ